MRTLLASAALAAALATTSSVAFAAVQHATGTVKTFDNKAMTLTLDDGSMFSLSPKFKDPGLKIGEKVRVSWDQSGQQKMAERVILLK